MTITDDNLDLSIQLHVTTTLVYLTIRATSETDRDQAGSPQGPLRQLKSSSKTNKTFKRLVLACHFSRIPSRWRANSNALDLQSQKTKRSSSLQSSVASIIKPTTHRGTPVTRLITFQLSTLVLKQEIESYWASPLHYSTIAPTC